VSDRAPFDTLHDATLHAIAFDWRTAIVRVQLTNRTIVVEGVLSLVAPRLNEWGPSVSILEGELAIAGEIATVTLRMQSGDDIVIVGRAASIESA
jgi:hypothetical protein